MSFLYPYALWGLLGLSLPIIIHILSGREQSIVQFGSIRFLKPSESDAARSLGMSQYCLLYTSPSPRDRQKSRMPSSA